MTVVKIQKNIPSGWKALPIGKHIKLQGGNAFSASNYVSNGIPLVRIGNVGKGDFVANDFVYISEDEHASNESVHLKENDILMGMTGELGKVARIGKQHLPAILNQRVGRIVFKDNDLNPDFTFQIFLSKDFKSKLEKYFIGAAQKNISSSQVESIEVLLPPIKEQQKIAEILGTVDEDIAKTQEVIEATEKLKCGLMQQLFTRGIGHTKFKESKIGQIPEEWRVVSLQTMLDEGLIVSHLDGNHGELYPKSSEFTDEGVPYLSANCIEDGHVNFVKAKYLSPDRAAKFFKGVAVNGDILFAHNATVGPVAILNTNEIYVILSTTLTYYRCNTDKLVPTYLRYFMESPLFSNQYSRVMAQTTRNQVPITIQRTFLHALPTYNEQEKIADVLSSIDEKISINKKLKEKLTLLKKGLTQDLLSGRVRTSNT